MYPILCTFNYLIDAVHVYSDYFAASPTFFCFYYFLRPIFCLVFPVKMGKKLVVGGGHLVLFLVLFYSYLSPFSPHFEHKDPHLLVSDKGVVGGYT